MVKKRVDFERMKMILLFVSGIIMMIIFAITVWGDLFHKDETIRQEKEREARRSQRMEMIKNMK
ncbi:hypothetical protein COJ17_09575 [Bacillus thuringiensis]|uniref:hypothetical protein n=1 Tax=Bacillus thuringiensis TaxID=1428 RepID=UPI000BFAACA3|nr:hypothetical protein [Bacillus thuringiensis]PEW48219.1 hypothetical protein CN444_11555 [Bacillus thuringiensis]PFK13282.1 hypothetical protein COJ17_09575 [Bacillus thuringiensis]